MLFNSIEYFFFLPLVCVIYFILPIKGRWVFLLASSYFFYGYWKPEYLILIIISSVIDYFVALKIEKSENILWKKIWLFTSLCSNLGLLFTFKYFIFFNNVIADIFGLFNHSYIPPVVELLLPVGISFYTFQTLSYTIDVYKGELKAENNFLKFALFVSFFPQLVAGPIERAKHLLPQFDKTFAFSPERTFDGLLLIFWGLFKKVVIADSLAVIANQYFNTPEDSSSLDLIKAAYAFTFQIYCDFSGYSDIAIGSARIMGYDIMENFNSPYLAKSISDFWSKWHISLSTWFRDYVYIPLGGNRKGKLKQNRNIFIVFLLSGLWHGANYTYIIWGLYHGTLLLLENLISEIKKHIRINWKTPILQGITNIIFTLLTFHLVVIGWIFFRASNLNQAWLILYKCYFAFSEIIKKGILNFTGIAIKWWYYTSYNPETLQVRNIIPYFIILMIIIERYFKKLSIQKFYYLKLIVIAVLSVLMFVFGNTGGEQFIYFQF
jgi:D-alanyl-lipoteichoic acid acyltransferase DltB (MBOAT superfamily)